MTGAAKAGRSARCRVPAAMGLLGIVPILGAFIVWIPAAILLALSGEWTKALILTAWGSIVVATIDNLLYPMFVGKRLQIGRALRSDAVREEEMGQADV